MHRHRISLAPEKLHNQSRYLGLLPSIASILDSFKRTFTTFSKPTVLFLSSEGFKSSFTLNALLCLLRSACLID